MIEALPEIKDNAHDDELKKTISEHLEETRNQQSRLQEIADDLGIELSGKESKTMAGLIQEAHQLISEDAEDDVRDAGLIADVQKIEHYEIAVYGTAREYAKALDKQEAADKLNQSLQEESNADEKLNKIAISNINVKAKAGV